MLIFWVLLRRDKPEEKNLGSFSRQDKERRNRKGDFATVFYKQPNTAMAPLPD